MISIICIDMKRLLDYDWFTVLVKKDILVVGKKGVERTDPETRPILGKSGNLRPNPIGSPSCW
jgi:hypothetical protein